MRPPPLHYSQTWITSWLFLLLESNLYVLIHGILYGTSRIYACIREGVHRSNHDFSIVLDEHLKEVCASLRNLFALLIPGVKQHSVQSFLAVFLLWQSLIFLAINKFLQLFFISVNRNLYAFR